MDWNPGVFEELHDLGVYKQVDVLGSEVRPCANIFRETTGCTGAGVSMYRVSGGGEGGGGGGKEGGREGMEGMEGMNGEGERGGPAHTHLPQFPATGDI